MRFKEFLQETDFDDGIARHMQKLGYKKLGNGVDQEAYEEPHTGEVIKIFGYTPMGDRSHEMFEVWHEYCEKNKSNPFLPKFGGWTRFKFNGQTYLQIRMERLIELPNELGDALSNITYLMDSRGADKIAKEILDLVGEDRIPEKHPSLTHNDDLFANDLTEINKLAILLGEDFALFLDTLVDVFELADKHAFEVDLHSRNFMHRYDGHPVIVDPWVT